MVYVLEPKILKKAPHASLNGIHGGTLEPCSSERLALD